MGPETHSSTSKAFYAVGHMMVFLIASSRETEIQATVRKHTRKEFVQKGSLLRSITSSKMSF